MIYLYTFYYLNELNMPHFTNQIEIEDLSVADMLMLSFITNKEIAGLRNGVEELEKAFQHNPVRANRVKTIILRGGRSSDFVERQDYPIALAVQSKNIPAISFLIENGFPLTDSKYDKPVLIMAIESGDINIVKAIMQHKDFTMNVNPEPISFTQKLINEWLDKRTKNPEESRKKHSHIANLQFIKEFLEKKKKLEIEQDRLKNDTDLKEFIVVAKDDKECLEHSDTDLMDDDDDQELLLENAVAVLFEKDKKAEHQMKEDGAEIEQCTGQAHDGANKTKIGSLVDVMVSSIGRGVAYFKS